MAYFSNGVFPTYSTLDGSDGYQLIPNHWTSATEDTNNQDFTDVATYNWDGSLTDIQPSATWPRPDHDQPHNAVYTSWDFSNILEPGVSTTPLVPGVVPPDYWWVNQNGAWADDQPHAPPTGVEPTLRAGTQPHHAQANEQRDTEAVPPPHPRPYRQAGEDAPDQVTEGSRRPKEKEATKKLQKWARRRLKIRELPTFEETLRVAFDVISTMREMVNPEPHLRAGHSKRTAEGTKNADKDWKRRGRERWLLQGLSQYYPSQETWTRASLLLEVLKDLENLAPPSLPVAAQQVTSFNFDPDAGSSRAI